MTFEGFYAEEQKKIDSSFFSEIEKGFDNGQLLYQEVYNKWLPIGNAAASKKPNRLDRLEPLPFYEDFFRGRSVTDHKRIKREDSALEHALYVPHKTAYIMKKSDPMQVSRYDALIAEYNSDLDRIKRECDFDTLDRFYQRAQELIRETKEEQEREAETFH